MRQAKTRTAAIYARYSSDRQKESSIDDQIADCRELANREGYTIDDKLIFCDDAITGTSRDGRDGMAELVDAVRSRKFDVLLCESQSRLARDVEDFAFLRKRLRTAEISLHTYQNGRVGLDDIMAHIRSAIDQEFIHTLRKNVQQGMKGRARLGFRPTQLTYGYRHLPGGQPGEWEIDPVKAKVVRRIFSEYGAGMSPREICIGLTRDGIATPKLRGGNAWGHAAILGGGDGGMISNKLYIGVSTYNKQYLIKDDDTKKMIRRHRPESEWIVAEVPHLRIVDQELWETAQRVRQSRQTFKLSATGETVGSRRTLVRNKTHLLSGLLRCGQCGGVMVMCNVSRGQRYVRCGAAHMKSTCTHRRGYMLEKIKQLVIDNLCAEPDQEFEAREKAAYNLHFARMAQNDNGREMQEVEKQIAKLKVQQQRISDMLFDGEIDVDAPALKAKLKAKEVERVGLVERLRRLKGENIIPLPRAYDAYKIHVKDVARRLIDEIDEPSDAVRIAFRNLMDSIVVQPSVYGEPYVVDAFGSLAAAGIQPFPETRDIQKIVAEEGVSNVAFASSKVNPSCPNNSESIAVIPFGRWRSAA